MKVVSFTRPGEGHRTVLEDDITVYVVDPREKEPDIRELQAALVMGSISISDFKRLLKNTVVEGHIAQLAEVFKCTIEIAVISFPSLGYETTFPYRNLPIMPITKPEYRSCTRNK